MRRKEIQLAEFDISNRTLEVPRYSPTSCLKHACRRSEMLTVRRSRAHLLSICDHLLAVLPRIAWNVGSDDRDDLEIQRPRADGGSR
jgi:hypothetical protein